MGLPVRVENKWHEIRISNMWEVFNILAIVGFNQMSCGNSVRMADIDTRRRHGTSNRNISVEISIRTVFALSDLILKRKIRRN